MENGKIKGTLVKVEELAFWDKFWQQDISRREYGATVPCTVIGGDCGMAFL